jgi:hypothetical protein
MSSTYSTSLRIQLIDTGTELEAWGTPTDNNLGTIIEQAIVGANSISLTGVSTYTLSTANAAVDQSRNAVLVFTGTPTANCNVIAPSVNKVYIVKNGTSGGYTVNIKTASGNAVVIAANTTQLVYCNSVSFISAVNINNVIGNLNVTGDVTVSGNVTVNTTVGKISNSSGNLTLTSSGNTVNFSPTTGAFMVPVGNTAQRPATPKNGMSRWNSELGYYEIWNGAIWQAVTGLYNIQYVIVAGGGAGGGHDPGGGANGGGGGAGGLLSSSFQSPVNSTSYTVTVGAGGATGPDGGPVQSGSNSSVVGGIVSAIAIGGGGGGNGRGGGSSSGQSGGSGGGGSSFEGSYAGSGTAGQGYSGSTSGAGGGGGGAGVAGSGSSGGNGVANPLTGSTAGQNVSGTYYLAGGGGGGSYGTAGIGGGGYGGYPGSYNQGGSGQTNTGGGAGGSGGDGGGQQLPSAGGSGVVVFRYQSPIQKATGGTVTSYSSGGYTYWIHTFTSSGTFTTS